MARRRLMPNRKPTDDQLDNLLRQHGDADSVWAAIICQLQPETKGLFSDLDFLRRLRAITSRTDLFHEAIRCRVANLEHDQ